MTHLLPPNLLRLFTPRPQLPYSAPLPGDRDPNAIPRPKQIEQVSKRKRIRPLDGVAATLERIKQDAADRGEVTEDTEDTSSFTHAKVTLVEMAREDKKRAKETEKKQGLEKYDPSKDPEAVGDPFKTLFLARLAYDVTEKDLHREFDMYGPIERIRLVRDPSTGKSRGYAFILYERERDMRAAYKDAEGIKILGRRVMVDVERGRTVKDWKPMRLGGGLGGSARKPKKVEEPEPAARPMMGGGGFGGRGGRGGFRGGSRGGGFRGGAPRGRGGPPRGYAPPPGYGGDSGYGARGGGGGGGGYGGGGGVGGGGYGGGGGGGYSNGGYGGGGGYDNGPPAKRGRY